MQAFKQGMYGPGYVWIWSSVYKVDDWMSRELVSDCTPEQVLTAADGHFTLHNAIMSLVDKVTVSGKVSLF